MPTVQRLLEVADDVRTYAIHYVARCLFDMTAVYRAQPRAAAHFVALFRGSSTPGSVLGDILSEFFALFPGGEDQPGLSQLTAAWLATHGHPRVADAIRCAMLRLVDLQGSIHGRRMRLLLRGDRVRGRSDPHPIARLRYWRRWRDPITG